MKLKNNSTNIKKSSIDIFVNTIRSLKYLVVSLFFMGFTACTDFVEVDPPKNNLISETVFDDAATVESTLANLYYKMREQGMVSGNFGFSVLMGIYSDELDYYGFDTNHLELYEHAVSTNNANVLSWWKTAYNIIYATNDIIKGLDNTNAISLEDQKQFKGQALFIRAYIHSLLTNVYGDIPYITTTDYVENNSVSREPANEVYEQIIADLKDAISLLDNTDTSGEHVIPNRWVAKALLARMYLYTENWELAEVEASEVISAFSLEPDVNAVFLKASKETLWQFKPDGINNRNTYEANQLIIRFIPGQSYALNSQLLEAFEPDDLRRLNWVGSTTSSDGLTTLHYAYKYKAIFSENASLEYSIIFRLAEQYLIRAEARTNLGNINGAQEDLNIIRNRAGLDNTTASTPSELLIAILKERYVELFTEHGHRWFDLKRMGFADDILSPIKEHWQTTDILLPIPETELQMNSNLKPQNSGY
ncbi:MAG: RagB/SusD family nutrient uptake outer membrane protein [Flavobacteriaceae bacterium CG17_big_fil_post_rev_8_21_14_2_50_33_15]|nr:MAG: RagB/SusD family nutrient uptake outer membrane protein [Flavobacteriaceae bacterium CG17_big_fil_post_rev_8_21_14_2_50_33_15]PJB20153.1 MAG: RagB/SusD family nutrient uptake outer membrane protein [Flavobacteriaceae bacterium CG_4_9_14_3_um_filter_33_16]